MINTETLLKRWSSPQRMFMIADVGDFVDLTKKANIKFYPITKYLDKILVSNQEIKI